VAHLAFRYKIAGQLVGEPQAVNQISKSAHFGLRYPSIKMSIFMRQDQLPSMDQSWRALVDDPVKLDALVESMSRAMASFLHITNSEIGNGMAPLGKYLYEQKERFPTRAQLDELDFIERAFSFVLESQHLASAMRLEASNDANVVLAPFARKSPFKDSWTFTRPRGRKTTRVKVGGIAGSLYKDVIEGIYNWLLECDQAMCTAFKDVSTEPPFGADAGGTTNNVITALAMQLAEATARRVVMLPPPEWEDEDDDLTTASLQRRASVEMNRTHIWAQQSQQSDLEALRAFEIIAREGVKSPQGRKIMETNIELLAYVVQKPPVELGMKGENAKHMDLALLRRACAVDLDIDVRCGLAHQWHLTHGGIAATAAQGAIQEVEMWSRQRQKPFIKVLQSPPVAGQQPPKQVGQPMPRMPFVNSQHEWRFVITTEVHRARLDWIGRRVVRLVSMVLQLLGWGALEKGVIASHHVHGVATQASIEARCVLELLRIKRDGYALGTDLLKFCEDVSNYESHVTDSVDDALLHVSGFSMLELSSIFHSQSPALRLIMDEFGVRTRGHLMNQRSPCIPEEYVAFAYDAMAILLPVIDQRRKLLSIGVSQATNPVAVLLRRLDCVKGWHPIKGALHLTNDDLKGGPALLKPVLQELAERKILVEYKRPYLGKQKHGAKLAYVFNTIELVRMLAGQV